MKKDQAKYKISPKGKRKLDFPKKNKPATKLPLAGKTLYLDVKDVKCSRKLETNLKKLGGTIEEFLSKDINYLITSQPRPKVRRNPDDLSPTPSPFNCDPSPSPGSVEERKLSTNTRGRAIAEKARIQTKTTSTVVDNAEKWGVKIVTLEVAFKWLDKELKKLPKSPQNTKVNNVKAKSGIAQYKTYKAPFLKFEVETHCYKPCTSQLEAWPRLNVDTPRGSCPFDGTLIAQEDRSREERGDLLAAQVDVVTPDTPQEEKDDFLSGAKTHTKSVDKPVKKSESDVFCSSKLLTAGEMRRQREQKRRQERKRGYCECCHVKYEDLDKHCRDDQHRDYVRDKTHFEELDQLIKTAPSPVVFLKKEKMKALEAISKQKRTVSHEEEDEVVLIPVTPTSKTTPTAHIKKDMGVLAHSPKSPLPKNSSRKEKERNKDTNVDLRKMTPNGKNFLRIVKTPKQISRKSPQQDKRCGARSPLKDNRPDTRNHVNSSTFRPTRNKQSPEKIIDQKHDNILVSNEMSLFTASRQINSASIDNVGRYASKIKSVSPVKLSTKSPHKSKQTKKVTESLSSKSPDKPVQNQINVKSPHSLRDSSNKSSQYQTVKKSPVSLIKSPYKSQVNLVIKSLIGSSTKSPSKSSAALSQDRSKAMENIQSNKESKVHCNRKDSDGKGMLEIVSDHPTVGNKIGTQIQCNRGDDTKEKSLHTDTIYVDVDIPCYLRRSDRLVCHAEKESLKVGMGATDNEHIRVNISDTDRKNFEKEKFDTQNSEDMTTAGCDNVYEINDKNHEICDKEANKVNKKNEINECKHNTSVDKENILVHRESEQQKTESSINIKRSLNNSFRNDDENGTDLHMVENLGDCKDLVFDVLVDLGRKKLDSQTSSDDFEKCMLKAISQGDLSGKKVPEYNETDRVLRSKKSLDSQEIPTKTESLTEKPLPALNQTTCTTNRNCNEIKENDIITCKSKLVVLVEQIKSNQGKSLSRAQCEQNKDMAQDNKEVMHKPEYSEVTSDLDLPLNFDKELIFSATLAERVKTRPKRNLVTSYASSPIRSRSNSVSSNNSDSSTSRKTNILAEKVVSKHVKHLLQDEKTTQLRNQNPQNKSPCRNLSAKVELKKQHDDIKTALVTVDSNISQKENQEKCDFNWESRIYESVEAGVGSVQTSKLTKNMISKVSVQESKQNRDNIVNSELKVGKDDVSKDSNNRLWDQDTGRASRSKTRQNMTHIDKTSAPDMFEGGSMLSKTDTQLSFANYCDKSKKEPNKMGTEISELMVSCESAVEKMARENTPKIAGIYETIQDTVGQSDARKNLANPLLKAAKETDLDGKDGRKSPVFIVSPVAKRRNKSQKNNQTSDYRDKRDQNNKGNLLRAKPLSSPVSHADNPSDVHISKCQKKLRISRAIRESFTNNSSSPSNKDTEPQNDNSPVAACDFNASNGGSVETENSINEEKIVKPTTPNCKRALPSSCPYGSGYSATPRSERRKAWKRKNVASEESPLRSNKDVRFRKRRKLDKLKFVIPDDDAPTSITLNQTKSPVKSITTSLVSGVEDNSVFKRDNKNNTQIDPSPANSNNEQKPVEEMLIKKQKELNSKTIKNSSENISLHWKSAAEDNNKVKLDKSWSLLSSRSVTKLLSSEDGRDSFDGFTEEDIRTTASLASDMSFEECWEVDKSINSEKEFEVDLVEKEVEDVKKDTFENFLPVFSSPSKRSDSSWFDACESYMDKTVQNAIEPVSIFRGWTSPRKKSVEKREMKEIYMSPSKSPINHKVKKRVKHIGSDTEQVDMDIQFYYKSPQKDRLHFSPLGMKNGRVVDRSSPRHKTSTPSRRIRYGKDT